MIYTGRALLDLTQHLQAHNYNYCLVVVVVVVESEERKC